MQCVELPVKSNLKHAHKITDFLNTLDGLTRIELVDMKEYVLERLQNSFPRDVPDWTMKLNAVDNAIRTYDRRH